MQKNQAAKVRRYQPTPVYLPEDGPLSRVFLDKRQHLKGRPPLELTDYTDYDTHTVFHDVFIAADGRSLRAIGPPVLNLKKDLFPVSVTVSEVNDSHKNCVVLKHKQYSHFRLSQHRFTLPAKLQHANQLQVRLRFANGLSAEQIATKQTLKPVTLQFSTLQKNNPIEWIVDWLRYCQGLGVERVLLYDNGSDDVDAIETTLRNLALDLEILLIDWPFPYGPKRSYYNRFTQATQNNHTYQCFGNATWSGHFDIDEFLVIPSGEKLIDLLGGMSKRVGLLRFDSYLLPNVREHSDHLPTVRDFHYRSRASHAHAHKYIARNKALKLAKIHNGYVKFGYWRTSVKPEKAVFYHCLGLTTNWRENDPRIHRIDLDLKNNTEDLTLIERFRELDR